MRVGTRAAVHRSSGRHLRALLPGVHDTAHIRSVRWPARPRRGRLRRRRARARRIVEHPFAAKLPRTRPSPRSRRFVLRQARRAWRSSCSRAGWSRRSPRRRGRDLSGPERVAAWRTRRATRALPGRHGKSGTLARSVRRPASPARDRRGPEVPRHPARESPPSGSWRSGAALR